MSSNGSKRKGQGDEELIGADYSDGDMSKKENWYSSEKEENWKTPK